MRLRSSKSLPLLAAALAALVVLLAACADEEAAPQTPAAAAFPVTVTDSNGKRVTFEAPPQAIVALAPSFVEIMYALGAADAVLAVDENTDFPPEAAAKTKLSGFEPSVEGIAALQPDLVLLIFDPGGLQDALEALAIPVLFLESPASVQGVFDQIELLGRLSDRLQEAEALIADMQGEIDTITGELADIEQGPSVFHELDTNYFTVGPDSFLDDLYRLLKARNIAEASGQPFPQLSAEAIIEAAPDVIILADEDAGESPETVKARPGWDSIPAVQNDRIYIVDPDIVSRPGPRLVEALESLARLLYPETFP